MDSSHYDIDFELVDKYTIKITGTITPVHALRCIQFELPWWLSRRSNRKLRYFEDKKGYGYKNMHRRKRIECFSKDDWNRKAFNPLERF